MIRVAKSYCILLLFINLRFLVFALNTNRNSKDSLVNIPVIGNYFYLLSDIGVGGGKLWFRTQLPAIMLGPGLFACENVYLSVA